MSEIPLMERFLAFAELKPADEEYVYGVPYRCAIGQFTQATGDYQEYAESVLFLFNTNDPSRFMPLEMVAMSKPFTWGGVVERIKELELV